MAHFVLTNAAVRVNAVDLSDHVTELEVTMNAEDVEATTMGATSRQYLVGLREDSFNMTFLQDFSSGEVDATLNPLIGGSVVLVEVWANGTVTSATNPKYSASCLMFGYQPLSGGIGDVSSIETEFRVASPSTAIVRATA